MGHLVDPGLSAPRGRRLVACALGLVLLAASAAQAAEVEARVASVRPGKVYLELREPLEVRLGARLVVRPKTGEAEVRTAIVAFSSRYLVVEAPGLETLAPGDVVRLVIDGPAAAAPRGGDEPPPEAAATPGLPVPTLEDYTQRPPPAFEPVPFRRKTSPGDAQQRRPPPPRQPAGTGRPAGGEPADADEDEVEPPANIVRGDIEVGVDLAIDEGADISRTTPYGRLALEVDRLGGSDRMRLRLYGSVRQPIDGEWDLTGLNEDHLVAELTALVLEVDAKPEEQVHELTDRIELRIGRAAVPWVVEAGVIDGAQVGIRFGSFTLFGWAGFGASPDIKTSDFDTFVYGGGVRFARTFTHSGALRLSLAAGQQRFRGDGERDFIEAQLDGRYDRLSLRGSLVIDLFDTIEDDQHVRLTTGVLRLGWQLTSSIRLEAGYSERRPQYQTELLRELSPPVVALLNDHERRTVDAMAMFRAGLFDLTVRGFAYLGDGARRGTGGSVSLGKNDTFARDRIALDVMVTHRERNARGRHGTDPYVNLSYAWYGEMVLWQLALFYRTSIPESTGDRRFGARASADVELGGGFAVRGFGEVELRRSSGSDRGEVFLLGAAVRYRF